MLTGILIGLAALTAAGMWLARVIAGDGYGMRPTPRSHPDEIPLTQHEKLRRLAR